MSGNTGAVMMCVSAAGRPLTRAEMAVFLVRTFGLE